MQKIAKKCYFTALFTAAVLTLSSCGFFGEERFDTTKTNSPAKSDAVTNSADGVKSAKVEEHEVTLDNRDGQLKIEVAELKVKLVLTEGWKIEKKKYRPSADDVPGLAMDGTGRHEIYNAAGDQVVYCSHYNSKVRNKEEQICPGALVRFKQKHLYIAIYGTPMSSEKEICEFARSINLQ